MKEYNNSRIPHQKSNTFIFKLFRTLQDKNYQNHIFWLSCGTGFGFHLNDAFKLQILENVFRCTNEHSFIRQLHLYGFNKIERAIKFSNKTKILQSYQHPKFIRDRPELLFQISRKAKKKKINENIKNQKFSVTDDFNPDVFQYPSPSLTLPTAAVPIGYSPLLPSDFSVDYGNSTPYFMKQSSEHSSPHEANMKFYQKTNHLQNIVVGSLSEALNIESVTPIGKNVSGNYSTYPFLSHEATSTGIQPSRLTYMPESFQLIDIYLPS
ncbi:hypothetical protein HMI55_001225 [Coelomomyces lativittatus]|nr:hypothetical protein HMI55_001225 [Coelomomyces lativittatus]